MHDVWHVTNVIQGEGEGGGLFLRLEATCVRDPLLKPLNPYIHGPNENFTYQS